MSRWERVDSACLVGILAFLLVLMGSYIPSASAAQQPLTSDGISTAPAITAPTAAILPPLDSPAVATEPAPVAAVEPLVTCEEDMPCWDCQTMGNRICGPQAAMPLPPCVSEDSDGAACYWDAQQRGNGLGRSFIWTGSEVIYSN